VNPGSSGSDAKVDLLRDPWQKSALYIAWWVFSRIVGPVMAIGLPMLMIYGFTDGIASDVAPLKLQDHEVALLVGLAGGESCRPNGLCEERTSRSYIVFPRVFSNAATVDVENNAGTITVTEVRGGAIVTLVLWSICVFALWYFWIRSFLKWRTWVREHEG
jgi:hypothetical protein